MNNINCNWTENDTKISYNEHAEPYYKIIECNSTDTKRDLQNVNKRYFCDLHMKKVIATRKIMHKNCINKRKFIKWLDLGMTYAIFYKYKLVLEEIKERIENGDWLMKKIKTHVKVINKYQEFFNQNEEQIQEFTKNWRREKPIDWI